ncbi:uncharacterized protein LOC132704160 [Cylas formicarius]|uniref:uncharacterized protein LOC132704160 n=1 Tax=Cylas formicarius TaxID=197179 RepID=UPI002958AE29|nr:uncharacterized protein LOC132704160 [Cylas formicarius]
MRSYIRIYLRMSVARCAYMCAFSALFLILGIVLICIRTILYNAILDKMLVLQPDSSVHDLWKITPFPLSFKIYMFNWTNPEDVYNATTKPKLQQLGPYSFNETKEKVNVTWNSNNTVSFMHLKRWYFDPKKSNGSLYDAVVSLNPVAVTAAYTAKDWSYLFKKGIGIFLGSVSAKVHSVHSVGQVLYDGYEDPIMKMAQSLPMASIQLPIDKFGWFYGRNGSADYEGVFNMDTGVSGQLGELYSWRYMTKTPYYPNRCGHVEGSAGEFFPTELRKDSVIKFFSADMCRFVELEYEKEITINGIVGYKYAAGDRFLDNGTKVPENKCFCMGNCMPYGVLNVSSCRYGSPAFVSLPHFHKADPYYTSLLDGVESDRERHDMYMIFEPKTALPLQVAARLQLNLLLQPIPEIRNFDQIPREIYFPVLWFEQVVTIPDDMTLYVNVLVNFETILLGTGIFLIWLVIMINACCCYKVCTSKIFTRKVNIVPKEEIPLNRKHKYRHCLFVKPLTVVHFRLLFKLRWLFKCCYSSRFALHHHATLIHKARERKNYVTRSSVGGIMFRFLKMKRRRQQCGQLCLLLAGILLITLGLLIFIYLESIYEFILNDALKFTPTSEPFRQWRINDPPLDMDVYLFNWTNAKDVKKSDVKPRFEEVGPYRFKEVKEKVNISWHDNNTVSYKVRKFYYFDQANSPRNLSDMITIINPVPLTVAYQARKYNFFTKKLLSLSLSSMSTLSVTKTANEILFEGFEDPILNVLSRFPLLNVQDRFGIFYGQNGTTGREGVFSMYTANDENFGKLLTWNYRNTTNFYEGHCNEIKGSAMEFYPLNRKRDRLVLFSSELCKYAELDYAGDVIIKGVRGYKFTGDNIFDNGTLRQENSCFCIDECIPSGVLDVSRCRQDSPSFLSFPHFYAADPYYRDQIQGMKPDGSKHEFFIIIEPKSGIIMDIGAQMQLNMLLQPIFGITLYSNVQKTFVPIFYFSQHIELKDELAANLRLIQNLPEYENYTSLVFLSLGTILILWGICSICCCSIAKDKTNRRCEPKVILAEEVPLSEKK